MKRKIAGAYLNLLIGKDLDIHHTGNQSGNITVHARGWHYPSRFFSQELGDLRAVRDGKSLQADVAVAGPGCRLALRMAGARHLEPAPSARTQPASESAQHSGVMNGPALSWQ